MSRAMVSVNLFHMGETPPTARFLPVLCNGSASNVLSSYALVFPKRSTPGRDKENNVYALDRRFALQLCQTRSKSLMSLLAGIVAQLVSLNVVIGAGDLYVACPWRQNSLCMAPPKSGLVSMYHGDGARWRG